MVEQDASIELARKERAMDEAPVGITISDPDRPDNPLIYVNDAFERITGYAREEVLGRNCRLLQGPETDEAAVARLRGAIEAGEPVTVELRNYRRNGDPFWNEVTVAPLRDDSGAITHFVGFQSDVTRRKEAELALSRERERLDAVFDRVDRLLDAVTTAIVTATSRGTLERSVCRELVEAGPFEAAWFGRVDAAADAVVPSASAGDPSAVPDGGVPVDADHPTAAAVREGELRGIGSAGDDAAGAVTPGGEGGSAGEATPIIDAPSTGSDRPSTATSTTTS